MKPSGIKKIILFLYNLYYFLNKNQNYFILLLFIKNEAFPLSGWTEIMRLSNDLD